MKHCICKCEFAKNVLLYLKMHEHAIDYIKSVYQKYSNLFEKDITFEIFCIYAFYLYVTLFYKEMTHSKSLLQIVAKRVAWNGKQQTKHKI